MNELCESGTCWASSLSEACDHWELRVMALENVGMEQAAKLGEAEQQLAGAVATLERIRDHANSGEDPALLAQHELDRIQRKNPA